MRPLVLVIDDDAAFRRAALDALHAADYDARGFDGGGAAIRWVSDAFLSSQRRGEVPRVPVAVLFDHVWPESDVRGFLAALEAHPLLKPIRRILTSKVDLGADDGRYPEVATVRVPIDPVALRALIERNTAHDG